MLANCAITNMETISLFIDSGIDIMLCSRLIQTSPVASQIHKHFLITSHGRHTAARQLNRVINWLLGPEIRIDGLSTFFIISTSILLDLISPGTAEAESG